MGRWIINALGRYKKMLNFWCLPIGLLMILMIYMDLMAALMVIDSDLL